MPAFAAAFARRSGAFNSLAGAAGFFIDRRPADLRGPFCRHTPFTLALFDMTGLPALFGCVFLFASSCHVFLLWNANVRGHFLHKPRHVKSQARA